MVKNRVICELINVKRCTGNITLSEPGDITFFMFNKSCPFSCHSVMGIAMMNGIFKMIGKSLSCQFDSLDRALREVDVEEGSFGEGMIYKVADDRGDIGFNIRKMVMRVFVVRKSHSRNAPQHSLNDPAYSAAIKDISP